MDPLLPLLWEEMRLYIKSNGKNNYVYISKYCRFRVGEFSDRYVAAIRSISTEAPTANPVTPIHVLAGNLFFEK